MNDKTVRFQAIGALVLFCGALLLGGCATMHGIGQDIRSAGQGIEDASDQTAEKISGN